METRVKVSAMFPSPSVSRIETLSSTSDNRAKRDLGSDGSDAMYHVDQPIDSAPRFPPSGAGDDGSLKYPVSIEPPRIAESRITEHPVPSQDTQPINHVHEESTQKITDISGCDQDKEFHISGKKTSGISGNMIDHTGEMMMEAHVLKSANAFGRPTKLDAILDDLSDVRSEAQEEGYPLPTQLAIRNAKHLVNVLYDIAPLRYEVYPTVCGEIAIDTPIGTSSSAIIICASDGSVMYIASSAEREFSNKCLSVEEIPDSRLRQVLMLLASEQV